MQIDADQSVCPACGADGLEFFPVFHHMICAYVGPEYDFTSRRMRLSEMPPRHCIGRSRLRDRRHERALHPMPPGNGGVAPVRFRVIVPGSHCAACEPILPLERRGRSENAVG
jgi:hypothetical protein